MLTQKKRKNTCRLEMLEIKKRQHRKDFKKKEHRKDERNERQEEITNKNEGRNRNQNEKIKNK